MPNLNQAKKALRQNKTHAERNAKVKADLEYALKQARRAVEAGDKTKALEALRLAGKSIDKAAQKRVVKPNTASRKKSRLHKKVNAMK